MSRVALVVGINTYQNQDLKYLQSSHRDAEAIAQQLTEYSDFNVIRFPEYPDHRKNYAPSVSPTGEVTLEDLQKALKQLFHPEDGSIPDTALFFFSGHGLQSRDSEKAKGYLATSDSNLYQEPYGLSLEWLQSLLEKSPVKQQIVWLDCCHSGHLFDFNEAALEEQGKSGCFIAACHNFEQAFANENQGLLSKALIAGLDPEQQTDGIVTNSTLIARIKDNFTQDVGRQKPMAFNFGDEITLTWLGAKRDEHRLSLFSEKICPYKGLTYFDGKDEDAQFFYGRDELTEKLLRKVDNSNFLAVLGASGSGKSSVLRAGLMYQLRQRKKPGNTDELQVLLFRPGEKPLKSLTNAFLDLNHPDSTEPVNNLQAAEDFIRKGTNGLGDYIMAQPAKRIVLIADQFEEAFTACQDTEERKQFFDCLLNAVDAVNRENFCLVLSMREDFLVKCSEDNEYKCLYQKIQNNQVKVSPMSAEELRKAIAEPAKKVGLQIQSALVERMIADVENSPGSLPLLQYTLTALYQECKGYPLTVQDYDKLGGIKKTLSNLATDFFNNLDLEEEQKETKRIFLELTQLGEGTEDTRRQIRKQDLLNCYSSRPEVVKQLIQKLTDQNVRLLVTSEIIDKEDASKRVEVVDVAHEALIRHWELWQGWLKESREYIRIERKIESDAKEWLANNRAEADLAQGSKLEQAKEFLKVIEENPDIVFFDKDAHEFVQKSIEKQKRIDRRKKFLGLAIVVAFAVTAPTLLGVLTWIWVYFQNAEIEKLAKNSDLLSNSNKQADAVVESLKAVKRLKKLDALKLPFTNLPILVNPDTRTQVVAVLRRAVYNLKEMNSLEGHGKRIDDVSFSPDGKTLASVDVDGSIKLWSVDGTLLQTIHGHSRYIYGISFSVDGKMLASASRDGTVKLWTLDGKLRQTLLGHGDEVYRAIFSPDQKTLVSASADGSIKFWSLDGKLIRTIQADQSLVLDISFSPDGSKLASSGADGTVKLWNSADGKLIKAFHAAQCNEKRCSIWDVSFSHDGKLLATGSDNRTIKLWKSDGTFVRYVDGSGDDDGGHRDKIRGLSFSPKIQQGKYILASASTDKTVRVWDLPQSLLTSPPKIPDLKLNNLELSGHNSPVLHASFTSDGKILASASEDSTVKLWNIERKLEELWHPEEKVKSVSFRGHGDDQTIASASHSQDGGQGHIKLWHWNKNSQKWESKLINAHSRWIWQVSFSPDGQTLASASKDGTLKLWSRSGEPLTSSENINTDFYSVSFSPDGKTLASGDANNNVVIWQYEGKSLTEKQVIPGHIGVVRSVSFSPDGQLLASADYKNIIKLWRREGDSWKFQKNLEGHRNILQSVTFSPDGQLLASSSFDGTVKLWNPRNGNLINTLYGHTAAVTQVTFSPDSQILASSGGDRKVILWSKNGTLLHTINEHKDVVYGVQFSPDGKTLASASDDGRVILWNLNLDDLLVRGCSVVRDYLRTNPSTTSEVRSFCNVPDIDAKLLVEQGRDLARAGNTEGAITKFQEAQQRGQKLDDPKAEADHLSNASKRLETGLKEAQKGKLKEAADNFGNAIKQDPAFENSKIEPDHEAKRVYALTLLNEQAQKLNEQAQKKIDANNIQQAIKGYKQVKALYPEIQISAKTLDTLCRAGSTQRQYVNDIMKYCEEAVRLDTQRPDRQNQNGKIRDSRGIARLFLKQDIKGAIADFQAFINWTQTEQARSSYNTDKPLKWKKEDWEQKLQDWRKQRQQCITALKPKNSSPVGSKTSLKTHKTQIPDSCKPIEFKL